MGGPLPEQVLGPQQVLSLLNLRRGVQGAIPASQEVLQALAGQAWQQGQGTLAAAATALMRSPLRPSALVDDDAWVTVLALAYLRRHLGGEQQLWGGLEAKALQWLAGVWPQELAGRSQGALVLQAMKAV